MKLHFQLYSLVNKIFPSQFTVALRTAKGGKSLCLLRLLNRVRCQRQRDDTSEGPKRNASCWNVTRNVTTTSPKSPSSSSSSLQSSRTNRTYLYFIARDSVVEAYSQRNNSAVRWRRNAYIFNATYSTSSSSPNQTSQQEADQRGERRLSRGKASRRRRMSYVSACHTIMCNLEESEARQPWSREGWENEPEYGMKWKLDVVWEPGAPDLHHHRQSDAWWRGRREVLNEGEFKRIGKAGISIGREGKGGRPLALTVSYGNGEASSRGCFSKSWKGNITQQD